MATIATASAPSTTLISNAPKVKFAVRQSLCFPAADGLRFVPMNLSKASRKSSPISHGFKTRISCSAELETTEIVQDIIANQLSVDKSTVTPQSKFADLGADSLDTVEIMMALEEKFEVSIGEGGAENIATVQDAADLIEKVKAASS